MKRDVLIALGLLLVALWQNLADLDLTPFHPDETRWLNRAHYLRDLADPFGPTWQDGYLTRGQPPLGSYLIGLGLLAQGRDLATNGVWNFRYGAEWNQARGNMAGPADLAAGRRTNAAVGALTVVIVYLVGVRLTNRVGGLVAALFLAAHPLMIDLSSRALADALLVLLLALAALAAGRLADRPSWRGALLLGGLLGLGGATKLSPLLLTLPLAALGAGLLARVWWLRRRHSAGADQCGREPLGGKLLALPAIAAVVFVAVYPYLWPDPIGRTVDLFAFRVEEMARQGDNWEEVAVGSRTEALRRVGVQLGDRFTTSGRLAASPALGVGIPRGLDLLLATAGAEIFVALAVLRGARSRHALTLLLLGGESALIVLGLRADFARYHLPILLAMAVCLGILAGTGWSALIWIVERTAGRARLAGERMTARRGFAWRSGRLKVAALLIALVIGHAVVAIQPGGAITTAGATPVATPGPVATPATVATPLAGAHALGTPQPGVVARRRRPWSRHRPPPRPSSPCARARMRYPRRRCLLPHPVAPE